MHTTLILIFLVIMMIESNIASSDDVIKYHDVTGSAGVNFRHAIATFHAEVNSLNQKIGNTLPIPKARDQIQTACSRRTHGEPDSPNEPLCKRIGSSGISNFGISNLIIGR